MNIGIPKEVKDHEYRVGMTPAGVRALVDHGHTIYVEDKAGEGSGFSNEEFEQTGATILPDADAVYHQSEMIIKVKEPIAEEYGRLQEGQILYTYLHLAPLPELTDVLLERKICGIAYETVTDRHGNLPLLTPMSEVAGRMSVLVGATYLQRTHRGCGVLISGVPGVPPANVVVVGGGIVGLNALKMAQGMRARVTVLEKSAERMRELDDIFQGTVTTLASNEHNLEMVLKDVDLLIGAVLIPGATAPKLVTRDMLSMMKKRAVMVDVAVDQGGCFETTKPTTHSDPVYEVDGILHYCVANMPGAVPRTSTMALTNVTLPFALKIANMGVRDAMQADPHLANGVNTFDGHLTCEPVAKAEKQVKPYRELSSLL